MKKILSIVLAVAMLMSVCTVNAFALKDTKGISTQIYAQPTSDWSWHSTAFTNIPLGESAEFVVTDLSAFDNLDTTASINFGIQTGDDTLENDGETSHITYTVSDITIKAEGYADYVIPAQVRDVDLTAKAESWGLSGNSDSIMVDVAAACGSSEVTDCAAYLTAMTEITFTVTYEAYNGVKADGTAYVAPAAEDTTTSSEPAAEPAADDTTEPAETGIVLALLPMAVAAAAVVVSKRK